MEFYQYFLPVEYDGGVEDTVASMHHVVVYGDNHHGWIKNYSTIHT